MPPEKLNMLDSKFYIDGKEIPCEIVEIETTNNFENNIDNFGLHFDSEKEISFTCELSKFNDISMLRLVGVWELLKWYHKILMIIKYVFKIIRRCK